MCDKRQDQQSITSEVGTSFGAVKSILTDTLGVSKVYIPEVIGVHDLDIFISSDIFEVARLSIIPNAPTFKLCCLFFTVL